MKRTIIFFASFYEIPWTAAYGGCSVNVAKNHRMTRRKEKDKTRIVSRQIAEIECINVKVRRRNTLNFSKVMKENDLYLSFPFFFTVLLLSYD